MMKFLQYLYENPSALVALFGVVYALISSLMAGKKVREGLLSLMLRAEKSYNLGEFGPIAKAELLYVVVDKFLEVLLPTLPFWVRPMVTRTRLLSVALGLYLKAKDLLDDGVFNDSGGVGDGGGD